MTCVRLLRWLDALVAIALSWLVASALLGDIRGAASALIAVVATVAGAFLPPLRVRWRPASAAVGVRVSRRLRPGDHAWYVRPHEARLVLVTARRRWHVVIATPDQEPDEGLTVRRTRVFLIPADG